MKKFFEEFKKFITRGNVVDMAVGVIVGSAFTAIVNGLSNFVLKPIINWLLALILGKDSLSNIHTFLIKVEKAEEVLSLGLPTILCPNSHFYFDYPQSDSPSEPESMPAPVISTEKVFGYTPPSSSTVIGIQGNLWSEYIYTPELLFYKAFPRAASMAERAWGSPLRPFSEFYRDYVHLIDKGRQE